jgi:hypothetical protein
MWDVSDSDGEHVHVEGCIDVQTGGLARRGPVISVPGHANLCAAPTAQAQAHEPISAQASLK